MQKLFVVFGVVLGLCFTSAVIAATHPSPVGHVNDFANLMTESTKTGLEEKLRSYNEQTGNEISVVTIQKLEDASIEEYAVGIFEQWGIGKKDKDTGVLLLVSKDDRKVRIEVGYGLEPYLTDSESGSIIRRVISPRLKENNYDVGIVEGTTAIQESLEGVTEGKESSDGSSHGIGSWLNGFSEVLFFIPFLGVYVFSYMARTKSIVLGGLLGSGLGGLVGNVLGGVTGLVGAAVGFGLLGLLLDWFLSRNYKRLEAQHKKTDWFNSVGGFYGGGFGKSGDSGGGFGGFGGGSSGGGGASGDW